jgi:hypothetical protein
MMVPVFPHGIEAYFSELEGVLRDFPSIRSYILTKKIYNLQQGFIGGKIVFENSHSLEFVEVVNVERAGKVKYRYQYMDAEQNLIFRYDNAPHHPETLSFPHHKHTLGGVRESQEPDLAEVLFEISRKNHTEK